MGNTLAYPRVPCGARVAGSSSTPLGEGCCFAPGAILVHIPIHASWLNQIEIYFSIVQRKVLTPNDFCSLDDLEQRLLTFQSHYERTAAPFQWTFARRDLQALLARIDRAHLPAGA